MILTIEPIHEFWGPNKHEPLLIGIYLPLLPPLLKYRPWRLKYTQHVGTLEREVRRMQTPHECVDWDCVQKFLFLAGSLPSLPDDVAREVLQEKAG